MTIIRGWVFAAFFILLASVFVSVYILKSGDASFAVLDTDNITDINNPLLQRAIGATKECSKFVPDNSAFCYYGIAVGLGYEYTNENRICEKLKNIELKQGCYQGYGMFLISRGMPIEKLISECLKTDDYEYCMYGPAREIGKKSAEDLSSEKCHEFDNGSMLWRKCYEAIGQKIGIDNKSIETCSLTNDKENCIKGYAASLYINGEKETANRICIGLKPRDAENCYSKIGSFLVDMFNMTYEEAFLECEKYPYSAMCKNGILTSAGINFFKSTA